MVESQIIYPIRWVPWINALPGEKRTSARRTFVATRGDKKNLRAASTRKSHWVASMETLESRVLLSAAPSPAALAVAQSDNQFAYDLFHQLAASKSDPNLFFSTYYIATALEMTLQGANGETAAQMIQALHLPAEDVAQAGIQSLYELFQADPSTAGYTLSTANRLWVKDNFQLLQSFLDDAQNLFGAQPQSVDFSDPVSAAGIINQWVSDQTNGKIQNLIPPNAINGLTRLILTNAIYFKGTWQSSFSGAFTRQADFTTAPGQTSPAQMMFQNNNFNYYTQGGPNAFQAIDLPYTGNNLDMLVILPTNPDLTNFDASLTPDLFNQVSAGLQSANVDLYLPRFQLSETYDLVSPLENLGITDAFGDSADFSGITDSEPLQISDVIHKSFIQVDEQGTEAAAATGVIARTSATFVGPPPPPPIVFDADHPFIVAIRDHSTGTILFLGQVTNPGNFTDGETTNPGGGTLQPGGPIFIYNPTSPVTITPPTPQPSSPGSIHLITFTPPTIPTTAQNTPSSPATGNSGWLPNPSSLALPMSPQAAAFLRVANGLGNPSPGTPIPLSAPPVVLLPVQIWTDPYAFGSFLNHLQT